jgi:hypothetical protein
MSDEKPTPEQVQTKTGEFAEEVKEEVKKTSSSLVKKVALWAVGILGVLGALVGILYLFKGKGNGPLNGAKKEIKKTKKKIARSDLEKKAELTKSKAKEAETIKRIEKIKEMEDEEAAIEELLNLIESGASAS